MLKQFGPPVGCGWKFYTIVSARHIGDKMELRRQKSPCDVFAPPNQYYLATEVIFYGVRLNKTKDVPYYLPNLQKLAVFQPWVGGGAGGNSTKV